MRVVALLVLLVLELAVFASVSGADMSSMSGILNYLELKFLDLVPGLAPVLVLSVGMTLVLVTAGIDLSVGSMLALVAAVMSLFDGGAAFWFTAVLLGLVVGVGLGLANGALVARLDVPPIVATLGTMIFYRGLCQLVMRDAERAPFFDVPGYEWLGGFSGALVTVGLVAGVGGWFWGRSRWRRELLLVGGNRVAARYAGVPVDRRLMETYAVMGVLAWVAATCFTARNGAVNASTATGLELKVLVAVVLEVGVNVPVQVMSSLEDIVASAPWGQVTSSPLAKEATASVKTIGRVGGSPDFMAVSSKLTEVISGSTPSTM